MLGSRALKRATLPALRRAASAVPSPPDPADPADPNGEAEAKQRRLVWLKEDTEDMEGVLALLAQTESELGCASEAIKAYERLVGWMRRQNALSNDMRLPRRLKTYLSELTAIITVASSGGEDGDHHIA